MTKVEHIFFRKQIRGQQKFRAISKAQSDARIGDNDGFNQKDLFGILMNAKDPETGRRFTTKELVSQGGEIIFAGISLSSPKHQHRLHRSYSFRHHDNRDVEHNFLSTPLPQSLRQG